MNQLKEAEKKATQLVQEARNAKNARSKEAKTEAETVINAYRAELESKYQGAAAKQAGSSGAAGTELQNSTNNDIAKMNRDYNARKGQVEQMLVDAVLKVDIQAPKARN